jgi:undecaprenyl-diphosphatase
VRFSFYTLWQRLLKVRGAQAAFFLLVLAGGFLALSFLIRAGRLDEQDYEVTQSLQHLRTHSGAWYVPVTDAVAYFFTFLGNSPTLAVVAAIMAVILFLRHRRHAAGLAIVTLIGLPLNMLLKGVVERPRPDRNIVEVLLPTVGLSYPSGHAMASTMVYGFIAALFWIHAGPNKLRKWATVGIALIPPLVSLSRVYVGAHFLSDVVGGMTAGVFCLMLMIKLYLHWTAEGPPPDPATVAANPPSPAQQRKVADGAPGRLEA